MPSVEMIKKVRDLPDHEQLLEILPDADYIRFSVTYGTGAGVGCHSASLLTVRTNISGIYKINKEHVDMPQAFLVVRGDHKHNPEKKKLDDLLKVMRSKLNMFDSLVEALSKTQISIWIIGDNLTQTKDTMNMSTRAFVEWLIENKVGVVTASPGVINRVHEWDPHFCQVWTWVPPNVVPISVPARAPVYNEEVLDPDNLDNATFPDTQRKVNTWTKWHKDMDLVSKALVLSKKEMQALRTNPTIPAPEPVAVEKPKRRTPVRKKKIGELFTFSDV